VKVTRFTPLAVLLCLQAVLLFSALDLLPVWGDELLTMNVVAHSVPEIVPIVQRDIHPPLYYVLLHYWQNLPLPWTGVAVLRAFSVAWALLATILLDLFWTRSWKAFVRWLALALFVLSPCLLLYSRMARSYSMQTALALLSVAMLRRWMDQPRSLLTACAAFTAVLGLLYTHYVPGIAVLAGFALIGWRSVGFARVGMFAFAVAAGYLPWLITLVHALGKWGEATSFSSRYAI